jgi:cytochrome P450
MMETLVRDDPISAVWSMPLEAIDVSRPELYQRDTMWPYFARLRREARGSFVRMDPPRHTEQRRVISPIVASGDLADMDATIRGRTAPVRD